MFALVMLLGRVVVDVTFERAIFRLGKDVKGLKITVSGGALVGRQCELAHGKWNLGAGVVKGIRLVVD